MTMTLPRIGVDLSIVRARPSSASARTKVSSLVGVEPMGAPCRPSRGVGRAEGGRAEGSGPSRGGPSRGVWPLFAISSAESWPSNHCTRSSRLNGFPFSLPFSLSVLKTNPASRHLRAFDYGNRALVEPRSGPLALSYFNAQGLLFWRVQNDCALGPGGRGTRRGRRISKKVRPKQRPWPNATPANARVELRFLRTMFPPMSLTLDQIVEEAQQWPGDVVSDLVDRLMLAKHGGLAPAIDAEWRGEAQRRLAELENGTVQGVPLEETLAKARALLGR